MKWCLIIFSLWLFNSEQIASSRLNCLSRRRDFVSRGVRKLYHLLNIYWCLILDFILADSNNVQRSKKSLIPLTNKCLEDNRVYSLLLIMVLYHTVFIRLVRARTIRKRKSETGNQSQNQQEGIQGKQKSRAKTVHARLYSTMCTNRINTVFKKLHKADNSP